MQPRYGYDIRALTEGLNSTLRFNCKPPQAGERLEMVGALVGFGHCTRLLQLARSCSSRQYSSCSSFVLDDFEETVSSCRLADIGSD
jgi:hypothetical protein